METSFLEKPPFRFSSRGQAIFQRSNYLSYNSLSHHLHKIDDQKAMQKHFCVLIHWLLYR